MKLDSGGNLTTTGTVNGASDRNPKENFESIDPREVLEKVTALPISKWTFKQDANVEHIGPMAQDFYSAFGLGMDNKHIATVDADGVALAAIQGLNQKVEDQKKQLSEKNSEIQSLQQRLDRLEKLLTEKQK